MTREPFKFLSTDEFERLPLEEKVAYVQRALEAINKMHRKVTKESSERRQRKRKR